LSDDWPDQETDNPLLADDRNYYKVEKLSRNGQDAERLLWAGNNLDKAREVFAAEAKRRPRGRYMIRQRLRVLDEWPRPLSGH
jgi:hypothetical protein